jgi:hypothetical protein
MPISFRQVLFEAAPAIVPELAGFYGGTLGLRLMHSRTDSVAVEVGEDVGAAVADGPATGRLPAARLSETIAMPPTINPRISNPSTIHPTRIPVLRGSPAGSASIGVPADSGRSSSAIRRSGSPSELIHHPT